MTFANQMIRDPVVQHDGALWVKVGEREFPLVSGRQQVSSFNPGWRATGLFTGFAPLLVLVLENEQAEQATWFLDHRVHLISNSLAAMQPYMRALLRQQSMPIVQRLLRTVTQQPFPVLDAGLAAFFQLPPSTRREIAMLSYENVHQTPVPWRVGDLQEGFVVYHGSGGAARLLSAAHIAHGLSIDWQRLLADSLKAGSLAWPSPVDGRPLSCQGSLVFDDFHFAFRFADCDNDMVFFVLVGDHLSRVSGVWFPSSGIIVGNNNQDYALTLSMVNAVFPWTFEHMLAHGSEIVSYFAKDKGKRVRFSSLIRGVPGMHIGHQLWNELSGIDMLVQQQPDALPNWIVMNDSAGTEVYGPLEELFPLLERRVIRGIPTYSALASYIYENDMIAMRITTEFVSGRLRRNIAERARRISIWKSDDQPPGSLRIVVGLRVENRTLTDPLSLLFALIRQIADHYPGSSLIFDAHNASGSASGKVIESNGEHQARRSPIDVELDIVAACRLAAQGLSIRILDTIGLPIVDSLAVIDNSNCFISIWGASLAKYRWVGNLPGYIISNPTTLLRSALHIYSDPSFMEDPTPTVFVDPALVTDHPESPKLVYVLNDPGLHNFSVDIDRTLAEIMTFLTGLKPGRTRDDGVSARPNFH